MYHTSLTYTFELTEDQVDRIVAQDIYRCLQLLITDYEEDELLITAYKMVLQHQSTPALRLELERQLGPLGREFTWY